jgi:phage terminase large subunit GpA-like protein
MIPRTNDEDIAFLKDVLDAIVDERLFDVPTEYIERIRYIRSGLSPKPGYFEFSFTPYWIEVFNCLAGDSGIQVIAIMKAAQIGYTVAILENAILYFMGSNPKYVQFITADNALIEETVKERINPMILDAGLDKLIYSQAKMKGSRATGNTTHHKEYPNGGINFVGSNNPDSFRGRTKQVTLGDEVDTFKDDKKEGSKVGLITNRSNAFSETRKMVWGSTPLIKQTSVIYGLFKQGDQRNYNIHCPKCGELIVLKWHGVTDGGFKYGIDFQHENGIPIYDTVHYKCQTCKGEFKDYDKSVFILSGSGIWIPTAKSTDPKIPHLGFIRGK